MGVLRSKSINIHEAVQVAGPCGIAHAATGEVSYIIGRIERVKEMPEAAPAVWHCMNRGLEARNRGRKGSLASGRRDIPRLL